MLKEKKLTFTGLKVSLSDDYIKKIQDHLSVGGGNLEFKNQIEPALCSIGRFQDPFKEVYTVIVLNETGEKILVAVVVAAAVGSLMYLLVFVFRRAVRYTLRTAKVVKKIVLEERLNEQKKGLEANYANLLASEKPSAPPLPSNYLTS